MEVSNVIDRIDRTLACISEFVSHRYPAAQAIVAVAIVACCWVPSGIAQTVTGSGTSGDVPVFTGTSTLGNSPIAVSGNNVGIGTTTPGSMGFDVGSYRLGIDASSGAGSAPLGLVADTVGRVVRFTDSTKSFVGVISASSGSVTFGNNNDGPVYLMTNNFNRMIIDGAGNVGIGTTTPGASFEVNGSVKLTSGSGASLTFADGTVQSTAYTGTCTATGGDYAESMEVTGERSGYEPGDVMVLAKDSKFDVTKSSEPYSTMVAGIYSTKPGYVGRRQQTDPKLSSTEIPMAMVGVVPTKVSAENGTIHRGDLLVTASKSGYAMRGTNHRRMMGAVVGKAMGSLDSGTGVIDVLVSLQ